MIYSFLLKVGFAVFFIVTQAKIGTFTDNAGLWVSAIQVFEVRSSARLLY